MYKDSNMSMYTPIYIHILSMEKCDICLKRIRERNRNKHEQLKKHEFFLSKLIRNKYTVKNIEFDNSKDNFKTYYVNQRKKFNSFTVLVVCKINGEVIVEIKLPSYIVMEKTFGIFNQNVDGKSGIRPCFEYIDDYFFINSFCDAINIIFISDFRDKSIYHYLNLPKSMLTRKLIISLLQNQSWDYTHKWLPNRSVYNYIPTDEQNTSKKKNFMYVCY